LEAVRPPDVTVCIPAYKAGDFIGRTLSAVARQSYRNILVLISIDGRDPATEAACRRFCQEDRRFEMILQSERRGWLDNTNALLDRVATEFFFILPHDDMIAETYVETLRAEALAHPEALVVFCDMQRSAWGREDIIRTPGLDGPFLTRVAALLSAPTEGVPWRGLTRSHVLAEGLRMQPNAFANYNGHALWVLNLLCRGPFRHVPLPLYRQMDGNAEESVTLGWRSRAKDERYAAMAEYTIQCIQTVSTAGEASPADRQALVLTLILRLLAHPSALAVASNDWPSVDLTLIRTAELIARMQGLRFQDAETTRFLQRDSNLRRWTAKLRVRDAMEAIAREDLEAAAIDLDSALALDPDSGDAFRTRAVLLRRQKRFNDALTAIKEAQRLLPDDARVRVELANLLILSGVPEDAVGVAREAIALDGSSATAHYQLSLALSRIGQIDEALEAADRAVAANPEHARFRELRDQLMAAVENESQKQAGDRA
jgi:tetratricopeptide (TPR) repeat protein